MRARPIALCCLVAAVAVAAVAAEIPPRPEQLTYPQLDWTVPDAKQFRTTLKNGVPVYIAEDRLLPLVTIQIHFRGGRYMEPAGKQGVADLTGVVWRTGGAGDLDAKALDERLDFLAAQLQAGVGGVTGMVSLNLLSKDLDEGLALLMDVLQRPRFEQARLDKARIDMLAEMQRRNDDTADIEAREWARLLYGDDYWINRLPTRASLQSITRDDLAAFHARLAVPANFVVAVAGDFDRTAMLGRLNATLGALPKRGQGAPPVPDPGASATQGVYLVDKPDVNQGRASIGHLGAERPLDDEMALRVANDIFGGGGFTSWMTSRVRSDEGLAYSAGSDYGIGDLYPGTFEAGFQTKSATVARATALTVDLMKQIQAKTVSEKELTTSKASFVETLPRAFETKMRTVSRFAIDELVGLPHEHWTRFRERVAAVDAAAVQAAARRHIHLDRLIVLVVGNVGEILKGDPDHPDVTLAQFGPVVRLPLRDPMTLEPLTK